MNWLELLVIGLILPGVSFTLGRLCSKKHQVTPKEDGQRDRSAKIFIKHDDRGFVRIYPEFMQRVTYPKHLEPAEIFDEQHLENLAQIDVENTLYFLAEPSFSEEEKLYRKRYITALAILYSFPIPEAVYCLDFETKRLYDSIILSMRAAPVQRIGIDSDELTVFDKDDPYVELLEVKPSRAIIDRREIIYRTHYIGVEHIVIQTLLQQHSGMICTFYPTFEKKLLQNLRRERLPLLDLKELRSIVTAVAAVHGLLLPRSYVRYTPLTALLINHPQLPKTPHLAVVRTTEEIS